MADPVDYESGYRDGLAKATERIAELERQLAEQTEDYDHSRKLLYRQAVDATRERDQANAVLVDIVYCADQCCFGPRYMRPECVADCACSICDARRLLQNSCGSPQNPAQPEPRRAFAHIQAQDSLERYGTGEEPAIGKHLPDCGTRGETGHDCAPDCPVVQRGLATAKEALSIVSLEQRLTKLEGFRLVLADRVLRASRRVDGPSRAGLEALLEEILK